MKYICTLDLTVLTEDAETFQEGMVEAEEIAMRFIREAENIATEGVVLKFVRVRPAPPDCS